MIEVGAIDVVNNACEENVAEVAVGTGCSHLR